MRPPKILILAVLVLVCVTLLAIFAYGVIAQRYKVFPYAYFDDVEVATQWFLDRSPGGAAWYYAPTSKTAIATDRRERRTEELNLVTSIGANDRISARVVDMQGMTVHSWNINWFDIWPDPQHVRLADRPKSSPGGHIHGIVMLRDGSIVFNFEKLAMVRMGLCGEIIWKLPYRTHHSVFEDEEGNLWASGLKVHEQQLEKYPKHIAPVYETTIVKISPDGEILREISVFDLLADQDLRAWLHMSGDKKGNSVSLDALHLNDVEIFPAGMKSSIFSPGDIMLSLRNIHTVLVIDPVDLQIKFWKTGGFVRQHDPDFITDGKIAIFDNNHIGLDSGTQQSRIVVIEPETGASEIVYTGNPTEPFYTKIMGKQQWLPDGDVLLTDSINGRAIQINPNGEIVWEYVNLLEEGRVGIVEEVQRLPQDLAQLFNPDRCTSQ